MRITRIGRWVVPGAALTLAGAATLTLVAWELAEGEDRAPARPAVVAVGPGPARRAPEPLEVAAPRRATPAPVAPAVAVEARRTPVRPTPAARRGAIYLGRVVRAPDLRARLDEVTAISRELDPRDAADALSGLLDSELPGDFYEAQALRLGVLAALGRLPAHDARDALARRLTCEWPRQERLMAIELMAARADARRDDLAALAEHEPDAQVRDKARWALARLP